jgi:hypothetical protein
VTALLLLGLGRSGVQAFRRSGVEEALPEHLNTLPALLAPALAVLLLATSYRLYAGYGIALAALGAAALLPWLAEERGSGQEQSAIPPLGRPFFGMLAAAILFRVYYESYNLTSGDIPLTAHYVMVGLIAGALSPWALGALSGIQDRQSPIPGYLNTRTPERLTPLLFALGALLFAVALPLLLALFWGAKAGGGLLLGLVIGQAYRLMAGLLEAGAPGLVAVAGARVPEAAALGGGGAGDGLGDGAAPGPRRSVWAADAPGAAGRADRGDGGAVRRRSRIPGLPPWT